MPALMAASRRSGRGLSSPVADEVGVGDLREDDHHRPQHEGREGDLGQGAEPHRNPEADAEPPPAEALAHQEQEDGHRRHRRQEEVLEDVVVEADQERHRRDEENGEQAGGPVAEDDPGDLAGRQVENRRKDDVDEHPAPGRVAEDEEEGEDRGREERPAGRIGVPDRPIEVDRAAVLQRVAEGDRDVHVTRLVVGGRRAVEEDPDRVRGGGDQRERDRRPHVRGVEPGTASHGRKMAAFSLAEVCSL